VRKVIGGFQTNAGDEVKVYPTLDAVAEALEAHAKDYGLFGFNMSHIYRNKRQLYHTPPALVKRLRKSGYWISIWFAYDPGTAEYYREAGANAFVTNWKERTFPEFQRYREQWANLMRILAKVPEEIKDAGSNRRNEALYFCIWEPRLASEVITETGKWPVSSKEVIDVLENTEWKIPEDIEPKK
jgi:hypothetical protein